LLIIATLGITVLAEIIVICFAAYKINANSFEFTAVILKLISLSIKIRSLAVGEPVTLARPGREKHDPGHLNVARFASGLDAYGGEPPRDFLVLVLGDPGLAVDDEVALP
jgi:hypothetical protein